MVKRISKKLLIILLLLTISVSFMQVISYADKDSKTYKPDEFTGKGDGESSQISHKDAGKIKTVGGEIVGIIQVVGTIIAVGMMIVLGIKYMM